MAAPSPAVAMAIRMVVMWLPGSVASISLGDLCFSYGRRLWGCHRGGLCCGWSHARLAGCHDAFRSLGCIRRRGDESSLGVTHRGELLFGCSAGVGVPGLGPCRPALPG